MCSSSLTSHSLGVGGCGCNDTVALAPPPLRWPWLLSAESCYKRGFVREVLQQQMSLQLSPDPCWAPPSLHSSLAAQQTKLKAQISLPLFSKQWRCKKWGGFRLQGFKMSGPVCQVPGCTTSQVTNQKAQLWNEFLAINMDIYVKSVQEWQYVGGFCHGFFLWCFLHSLVYFFVFSNI